MDEKPMDILMERRYNQSVKRLWKGPKRMRRLLFAFTILPGISVFSLASWEGHSKANLIENLGLPEQTMQTPDGEIFEYSECKFINIGGDGLDIGRRKCRKTMFLIKDDLVVKETKIKTR